MVERQVKTEKNSLSWKKRFTERLKCLIITCYVYVINLEGGTG